MPRLVSVQVKLKEKSEDVKKATKKVSFSVNLFDKLSDIDTSVCTIFMALYFTLVLPSISPWF